MLGRKAKKEVLVNNDARLLMQAMDKIIEGDFDEVAVSSFDNTALGEKINEVIRAFKKSNNPTVMRVNDVMKTTGDNTLVKEMLKHVGMQTRAINEMENVSTNLEGSISNISKAMAQIKNDTHVIMESTQDVAANMNDSKQAVNESTKKLQDINEQVLSFKDKIEKISEIVNLVENVAEQSSLLALNASIEAARAGEAGRGFAVVAEQVNQLATNTSTATQDIINYVEQLKISIGVLADSMEETTTNLGESNDKVEASMQAMNVMKSQVQGIGEKVDSIFEDVYTQTNATRDFAKQIESLSESYSALSECCVESGKHIIGISRYLDKIRSGLVRGCSAITEQDWLHVFEVDHFIFTWRIYNNIVGFESLRKDQVDNAAGCKLGKWLAKQTDAAITGSTEFIKLKEVHDELHNIATKSWTAKADGDDELALTYFEQVYSAFAIYDKAVKALQSKLNEVGYIEQTII